MSSLCLPCISEIWAQFLGVGLHVEYYSLYFFLKGESIRNSWNASSLETAGMLVQHSYSWASHQIF